MIRLLFLICFCLLGSHFTSAQTKADREVEVQEAIDALQTGGLVVRLTTNSRKIKALEAELSKGGSNARLEKMLTDTRKETQLRNQYIVQFMEEKYHLGPLYFLPDTAFSLLTQSESAGIFLNKDLELDPSITPPQGDFLIMRSGYSDPSNTSRAEGFIITNSSMEMIPSPFPAVVTFNNAGFALNSLLAPKIAEERRIQTAVERLVRKLSKILGE